MLSTSGKAKDHWSNKARKVVLPVVGSICGHKYVSNLKLTKVLFAMIVISVHPRFSRVILFSDIPEKPGNAH